MTEMILQVNGQNFAGWQRGAVTLGMEQIAGAFDLTVSDRFPGRLDAWRIAEGDECRLLWGRTPVITGYVDDVNVDYDRESHVIQVAGRDRTGDLVDCAALHKGGAWRKAKLTRIASDLCEPFGIKVVVETEVGRAFERFSIWHGETVFDCLERAARMRGVLLISDGQGNLVLTRAGKERVTTPLVKGVNIERGSGRFSMRDRYSDYIVKGQVPGNALNLDHPEQHLEVKATEKDAGVKRYRPHLLIAEPGDGGTYKDRALWERNVRAGRASRVTYTVTGWEHAAGLWLPNRLVPVRDDFAGLDGDSIIVQVRLLLDEDGGTRSELDLCRKEAFDLINLPDPKKKKRGKAKESLQW